MKCTDDDEPAIPEISHKVSLRTWLVFCALVLIWNIPNLMPWEQRLYPGTYLLDMLERLLKCLLLAAMFVALFARPWVAWLTSWLVGLWWLPISVAVRYVSDGPLTSSLVGMAMASSPGEIRNLVLSVPSGIFSTFLLWNSACVLTLLWLKRRRNWYWKSATRGKIIVYCGLLLSVPLIASSCSLAKNSSSVENSSRTSDPFREADQSIGPDAELPRAFPYELPWAIMQYWKARSVVKEAITEMQAVPDSLKIEIRTNSPDVVVLVIGESSSRRAWQLFNVTEEETTPRMKKRLDAGEHLLTFSSVVAQSISTRQAVPSMLTPQPLVWPDGNPNPGATRSIVAMASHAGYRTAWFSNQAAVGQFDGVIAAYADEAQTRAFLNPSSFFQQGSYDEVLLPALRRHLKGSDKVFVVLHTMGSHFRFDHRYPEKFGPFPVAKNSGEEYRNTVAYTDFVLDQVIDSLQRDGRSAAMLYVSDHGQGLADQRCGKSEINRVTVDAYEVPALVWLSQKFAVSNPESIVRMKMNANGAYTTAAVYQTLHDLMSGEVENDASSSRERRPSFLGKPNSNPIQLVATPGMKWVDYQDAARRNPCFIQAQ